MGTAFTYFAYHLTLSSLHNSAGRNGIKKLSSMNSDPFKAISAENQISRDGNMKTKQLISKQFNIYSINNYKSKPSTGLEFPDEELMIGTHKDRFEFHMSEDLKLFVEEDES